MMATFGRMMMLPSDFYQRTLLGVKDDLLNYKTRLRMITFLRLLDFVIIIWLAYLCFASGYVFFLPLLIAIGLFLWLMKQHALFTFKHDFAVKVSGISENGTAPFFKNNYGGKYADALHPYCNDFDLFGKGSLFHYLNKTETASSGQFLANALLNPLTGVQQITEQQNTIKELSGKPDFMIELRAYSALTGHNPQSDTTLLKWLNADPYFTTKKYIPVLLWLVPLISIASIAAAIFIHYYSLLVCAILLNWFFAGIYLRRTNALHNIVGKQKERLENFNRLNILVSQTNFLSPQLIALKKSYTESSSALRSLSKLAATFDQRLNTMLGPVLNSFFLFDLQCVYRIEKWNKKHTAIMQQWLSDMAQLEALVSMATYAFDHPEYVYPELKSDCLYFEAENLIHPIIGDKRGVANNFKFTGDNKVFIITGSNMSGKSTFLRTVGVSLLTAMNGLPVNAKSFKFSPFSLLSSMRIADSLQDSTSYFYAELKRLKLIIDETENEQLPALLFIDEMLKGTNSKEKLDGSVAIIEKLVTKNCVSFIATHDLALGVLESTFPQKVKNYSFESDIVNNELVFDYKIKSGVATSTNATFLLKKMKIV